MIGIALPQLITQIVSFLILMGVLYILLYKPLANMMRTRSEKIRAGLQAAEDAKQEVKDAEQRVEQEIQAARQQASGIISEAQAAAQKLTEPGSNARPGTGSQHHREGRRGETASQRRGL